MIPDWLPLAVTVVLSVGGAALALAFRSARAEARTDARLAVLSEQMTGALKRLGELASTDGRIDRLEDDVHDLREAKHAQANRLTEHGERLATLEATAGLHERRGAG